MSKRTMNPTHLDQLRTVATTAECPPYIGCVPQFQLDPASRIDKANRRVALTGAANNVADMRPHLPPVYNQGSQNSCVAHACAGLAASLCKLNPSRSFLYYYGRKLFGNMAADTAMSVKSGIDAMATYGICDESLWPSPGDSQAHPTTPAGDQGEKNKLRNWRLLGNDLMEADNTLANLKFYLGVGHPFVFGCYLFSSWFTAQPAAFIPMPTTNDRYVATHAMLAVGYSDWSQLFICRNSWGPEYGDNGHFFMSYSYMLHFGFDAWTGFQIGGEK